MTWSDASAPDGPARDIHADRRKGQQRSTARTAEATSIGTGGFTVKGGEIAINGGVLRLTSLDGTVGVAYFGPGIDGNPIWQFSFPNGDPAFGLFGTTGNGYWAGKDNAGNNLITNDAATGAGLARPTFAIPLAPTDDAELSPPSALPSTTVTAAGTSILGIVTPIWQPRLTIGAQVTTTGGGTGHWRMRINSLAGSTAVVSDETGFAVRTVDIPGWGVTVHPGSQVAILLEAWVTGGATRGFLLYDRCFTTGS